MTDSREMDLVWNLTGPGLHTRNFSGAVIKSKLEPMEKMPSVCWFCECPVPSMEKKVFLDGLYSRIGGLCTVCEATWVPKTNGRWTHNKEVMPISK